MSGQISIRLPENTIKRLNRAARGAKKKRAEILRSVIEDGLTALENSAGVTTDERLDGMHDDLRNRLTNLEALVQQVLEEPAGVRLPKDDEEAPITTPAGPTQTMDEVVVPQVVTEVQMEHGEHVSDGVELLPADSADDETATVIVGPEIIEIAPEAIEIRDAKTRTEFYESATGELQTNRRSRDRVIDVDPDTDQRISSRLRRARLFKGWDIETLSAELNMKAELLEDIENGRCDVPRSRGIRVEAKLQQWEWEAEMNG